MWVDEVFRVRRSGGMTLCTSQISGFRQGVSDEIFALVGHCAAYKHPHKLTYLAKARRLKTKQIPLLLSAYFNPKEPNVVYIWSTYS